MTDPLPQLETPMTPLATPSDQAQPLPTSRPPDYDSWSKNKKIDGDTEMIKLVPNYISETKQVGMVSSGRRPSSFVPTHQHNSVETLQILLYLTYHNTNHEINPLMDLSFKQNFCI